MLRMPASLLSLSIVNIVSLTCLFISCYYLCVQSESTPYSQALTVVDNDDNSEDVTISDAENEGMEDDSNRNKAFDVFYPTQEWQTVKKGQAIPAGLHVRMNMQTGETEAKLMEGDNKYKYWSADGKKGMVNTENKHYSHSELKRALKEFKVSQVDDIDMKRAEEIKKKFKKYENLKQDMAEMNMNIQTDGEIISGLVQSLGKSELTEIELTRILEDLEYHLHQIDNAVLFCDMGGIPLILKCLNSSQPSVRSMSAFAMGSALQSNPKVQIAAIQAGALQNFIRTLSTDIDSDVRKKSLYAISSMIRHFPFAQKKFLELGGISALKSVFSDSLPLWVKRRVVTLISDLIEEQNAITDQTEHQEKQKQYKEISGLYMSAIVDNGICDDIPALLNRHSHDTNEEVLLVMKSLQKPCQHSFYQHKAVLQDLSLYYSSLQAEDQDEREYYQEINTILSDVINIVQALKKDEL